MINDESKVFHLILELCDVRNIYPTAISCSLQTVSAQFANLNPNAPEVAVYAVRRCTGEGATGYLMSALL